MKPEELIKEIATLIDELNRLDGKSILHDPNIQDIQVFRKKISALGDKLTVLEFLMQNPADPSPQQESKELPPAQSKPGPLPPPHKDKRDLKGLIGLNDRFRFVNELFGGSSDEFNAALNQLNMMESLEEAQDYLERLSGVYNWKESGAAYNDFVMIIKQKLS